MLLFPAKDWGKDTLVPNRTPERRTGRTGSPRRRGRPRRGGRSSRIQTDMTTDWIALKHGPKSDQEKKAILSRLTQKRYYMDYIGAPEQAIRQYQRSGHGLLGAGAQAVSAGDMWALGNPGFDGPRAQPTTRSPASAARRSSACWPRPRSRRRRPGRTATRRCCGCSSTVSIPGAVSHLGGAPPTMETIVNAVTRLLEARPPRQQRPHPPPQPRLPRQAGRAPGTATATSASASPRSTT